MLGEECPSGLPMSLLKDSFGSSFHTVARAVADVRVVTKDMG